MKLTLAFLTLSGIAQAWTPSQGDLQSALDNAKAQWGVQAEVAGIRLSNKLGNCFFTGYYAWSELETRIIDVNQKCSWDIDKLRLAVMHEYGHMLFGPDHSRDKRSIMYKNLGNHRVITFADRNRAEKLK